MNYYIGIDIGGTNIKYGLLDQMGRILHKDKLKTSTVGTEIIDHIVVIVENYQKEYQIKAVGVSAPGIIEDDGFMVTGGAIFDFYGINLKTLLETRIDLPVFVENDANSAALAERWQGAGKDVPNFLTVVVGTGIGGGIIINGQLYKGASSNAGEFGFMVVEPIENQDTRMATLSLTGSVQSGIVNKYQEMTDKKELDGETVFNLAAAGDEIAQQMIAHFYESLSIGLFNLITAFDPEVILLGGAISANQEFLEEVQNRILALKKGHKDLGNVRFAPIKPCHFHNDAGIVGATYKAILGNQ